MRRFGALLAALLLAGSLTACGGAAAQEMQTAQVFAMDTVMGLQATGGETAEALAAADGLIVGTPVHYASPAGAVLAFLDRMFFAGADRFAHKPAAAFTSARRAGTTATLDVINKYFTISEMPIVSSTYWNMAHGARAADAAEDAEGMQTARNLARNMAWLLRCIEAGRAAGIEPPTAELDKRTNFIR